MCAQSIIFAGGRAGMKNIIERFKKNPKNERKLFKKYGINYIYEVNITPTGIPTVFQRSKEERTYLINDKNYIFPQNTLIGSSIALYHESIYQSKEFNPNKDYKNSITWNGIESDILQKNPKKRPSRYCPGHDLSFLYLNAYINKLHSIKI